MTIHIIREPATTEQINEMLQELGTFTKLAVDIEREVLAGGGEYHADCEQVLLEDGSQQENIWGADWYPETNTVECIALINIRPRQGNLKMEIQNPALRKRIESIAQRLLGR